MNKRLYHKTNITIQMRDDHLQWITHTLGIRKVGFFIERILDEKIPPADLALIRSRMLKDGTALNDQILASNDKYGTSRMV